MGIVAALGNTVGNIVLATAIINLPFYVRVARAEANVRRSAGWIEAARLSGNGDARILAVHLFPNALPPAMVQVSLNMGWAILNAAGLSFIGLGVRPPDARMGHPGRRRRAVHRQRRMVGELLPRRGADAGGVQLQPAGRCAARHLRSRGAGHEPNRPLLEVKDFGLEFRTRSGMVHALEGVDLQLHKGEIVGLVGESGSGKSVLSYALLGISDRAARVTGGSGGVRRHGPAGGRRGDAGRTARARDLDDLPEPAHRAQPDPPRRPADCRTCCAAMPPRPAPTWARACTNARCRRCATWPSPTPSGGCRPTPSRCPAACASA